VKILNSASRVLGFVATALLLPMMLLTVADVFLRFAFDHPITGVPELTALMMGCLPLAMAWCAAERRHIKVDLVMKRFKPRVQATVDSITLIVGLVLCIIITWRSFLASILKLKYEDVASVLLPVPVFPFHWIFVLGWIILCLVMVTLIIQKVAEVTKG